MKGPAGKGAPGRREIGAVRKEWGGRVRVALVYPNRYAAGMSNLGFLLLHAQINARPDALCERAFLDRASDRRLDARRGGRTRLHGREPGSGATLESGRALSEFDVVAFSLSYENDLWNLPGILAAGGVPPFREDRAASGRRHPLVVAGGFAASLNPEPSGVFADAVVVGDGERALDALLDLPGTGRADAGFFVALAGIPGVYVPAGYRPEYGAVIGDGAASRRLLALRSLPGFPDRVVREVLDLRVLPPPAAVVLAEDTELGSMSLVETSRGCPRMCGFCAAAHACPSFREFPLERVRAAVNSAWPRRKKVGLIGAAVLDWRPFRTLAREIIDRGGAVSPASVRADLVDEEIAEILSRSGHRTVSLAPECGDPRLRARVGKGLPDDVFFAAAADLVRAGIVSFKLYFLIGLPGTEREEEIGGIARFVREFRERVLAEARTIGRMGTITVVLSPFVPKPFTPFQWAPMLSEEELGAREEGVIAAAGALANLRWTAERPRDAVRQACLGLADRRAAETLLGEAGAARSRRGAGFARAAAFTVYREKERGEFFPWDVVEGGPPKEALRARYEAFRRR
jgi:radical SAM superfamily enzyme YgiQ (UPF0313 family)